MSLERIVAATDFSAALGARRKSRRERALLGSVAANVALIVRTDVLLVRHAEPARRI